MKLPKTTYRLELETDPGTTEVFEVTPILADVLRAELEAPKHGIDQTSHPIHLTVLWNWSAALRAGVFKGNFQQFKAALVNYEPVKATGAEVQGVPPTVPATCPHCGESLLPSPTDTGTPQTPPDGSNSSRAVAPRAAKKPPKPPKVTDSSTSR